MRFLVIVLGLVFSTSCASLFEQAPQGEDFVSSLTKYNDNPNHGVWGNRQYKKTTKSQLEEDSELDSKAGSLWVMDGQQSYYFTQNKIRKEGDFLNVKLEGAALKQVETKVHVIKTLLQELEAQEKESNISNKLVDANAPDSKDARAPAAVTETKKPKEDEKSELADVGPIQTRIIERLADGNYKIKGQQPFMIGKRDYKVLVVGIVRPEDYNDEGISSGKLIDPQFDVVSIRKKEAQQ